MRCVCSYLGMNLSTEEPLPYTLWTYGLPMGLKVVFIRRILAFVSTSSATTKALAITPSKQRSKRKVRAIRPQNRRSAPTRNSGNFDVMARNQRKMARNHHSQSISEGPQNIDSSYRQSRDCRSWRAQGSCDMSRGVLHKLTQTGWH
jgi:hypothetical protein